MILRTPYPPLTCPLLSRYSPFHSFFTRPVLISCSCHTCPSPALYHSSLDPDVLVPDFPLTHPLLVPYVPLIYPFTRPSLVPYPPVTHPLLIPQYPVLTPPHTLSWDDSVPPQVLLSTKDEIYKSWKRFSDFKLLAEYAKISDLRDTVTVWRQIQQVRRLLFIGLWTGGGSTCSGNPLGIHTLNPP